MFLRLKAVARANSRARRRATFLNLGGYAFSFNIAAFFMIERGLSIKSRTVSGV